MNEIAMKNIQSEFLKKKTVDFRPGDTIKVFVKIFEGEKTRIQAFEGVVMRIKNGGLDKLFTVRRVSFGIGIERTFFIHSPIIDKIQVVHRGKVRRAKLYYLRKKTGKDSRILTREEENTGVETKAKETAAAEIKPAENTAPETKTN